MKIDIVIGTRPEAIKLAPVFKVMKHYPGMTPRLVFTGQHEALLDGIAEPLGLTPDITLDVLQKGQSLSSLSRKLLAAFENRFEKDKPDLVIVQGDTSSSFFGALSAYYAKIPVAHVEAGLRTGDIYSPFPEEVNRKGIAQIAELHFAPTKKAFNQLREEGHANVHLTGNTVVDALDEMKKSILPSQEKSPLKKVLVTTHRREHEKEGLKRILETIKEISQTYSDVEFVIPVHLNPQVRVLVYAILGNTDRISLIDPLSYPDMIKALGDSWMLMTDSGGLQEEAPAFGLPVIVLREKTERMEAVDQGLAILCGSDAYKIKQTFQRIYSSEEAYREMQTKTNPFGDGLAGIRITEIIAYHFKSLLSR